jgi:hypothetical protein
MKILSILFCAFVLHCEGKQIVNISIGTDFDSFEKGIPKDRITKLNSAQDKFVFPGVEYRNYSIDKFCFFEICFSKTSRKITSMSIMVFRPGHETPKDSRVSLDVEHLIIDDNGSLTMSFRTPAMPDPRKKPSKEFP